MGVAAQSSAKLSPVLIIEGALSHTKSQTTQPLPLAEKGFFRKSLFCAWRGKKCWNEILYGSYNEGPAKTTCQGGHMAYIKALPLSYQLALA